MEDIEKLKEMNKSLIESNESLLHQLELLGEKDSLRNDAYFRLQLLSILTTISDKIK